MAQIATHPAKSPASATPAIVHGASLDAIGYLRRPGVQAVIVEPASRSGWEGELADAVEAGRFVVPRVTLSVARPEALVHALEQQLPDEGLDFGVRLALVDDLAALADALADLVDCRALMLRLFTEAPTRHCGFHVDTVAPGLPPYGLLKVYNGAGTRYLEPGDVADIATFYDYLGRRERLARAWRSGQDAREVADLGDALCALDEALPFAGPCAVVHEVPCGATVAFRHLHVSRHGSAHAPALAWLHCSPMAGAPRLVANLTPLGARAPGPPG